MNTHLIALEAVARQPFDLDSIQIATPCRADWGQMSGDDRNRHCKACAKNVYNLSALTRAEATRLICEKESNLCVSLHRRADGTVITSDCTVGISGWKKPHRALGKVLGAAMAAILSLLGIAGVRASEPSRNRMSGAPMMMGAISFRPPSNDRVLLGRVTTPPKGSSPAKTAKKTAKSYAKPRGKSSRSSDAPKPRRSR